MVVSSVTPFILFLTLVNHPGELSSLDKICALRASSSSLAGLGKTCSPLSALAPSIMSVSYTHLTLPTTEAV